MEGLTALHALDVRQRIMWPQEWKRGTHEVSSELKKWAGGVAQGWAYSVSHSQLLIRLFREEGQQRSRTSLYLYLKDCNKVTFTDTWRDANITIEEIRADLERNTF